MKRPLSALFAIWFAVSSTLYSVQSFAVYALAAGIATRIATAVTAVAAGQTTATALTGLAIGAAVSRILFPTDKGDVYILPKTSAENQIASSTGTAPTGASWTTAGAWGRSSAQASCQAAAWNFCYAGQTCTGTASVGATTGTCTNQRSQGTYDGPSTVTYSMAGTQGTCPSGQSIMPDGFCYATPTSGSIAGQLPQTQGYVTPTIGGTTTGSKPDNGDGMKGLPGSAQAPQIAGRPLVRDDGTTQAPATAQVQATTGGGVKVIEKAYSPTTGKTTATITDIGADNVIKSRTTVIEDGNTVTSGSTGGVTTGSTGTPTIEFPTDYNRETTQTGIRTDATTDRDQASAQADTLQTQVTQATASPEGGDPQNKWKPEGLGLPQKDDFQAPSTDAIKNALPDDSDCTPIQLTFLGRSMSLDTCPIVGVMKPILNWAIMFSAVIATWQFILGRRENA